MRKALCIGINAYPGGSALRNCVRDADAMAAIARGRGASVELLTDGAATKARILEALQRLLSGPLAAGDQLLACYSGHGTQVRDANGDEADGLDESICPIDFDFNDKRTWFIDDEVALLLHRYPLPLGVSLLINLDSCHAGTMLRGGPFGGKIRTLTAPSHMFAAAVAGWRSWVALPPAVRMFGAGLYRHIEARHQGTVGLLAATRSNQLASDGAGVNGAHTQVLCEALREAPSLPLRDLVRRMRSQLSLMAGVDQTPTLYGDVEVRRMPFFGA